ncbi:hypothetical protein BDW74DRAFT_172336 [Aspergillus multicolor]|uniref:uncharacterized protein n=1 Tax=Aspergillus multicolor TaxID=41759 RepID=UPI003CCDA126
MEKIAVSVRKRNGDALTESAGLCCKVDAGTQPGIPRAQSLQPTAQSTSALIAACKAGGVSIMAAVHTASAEVVFAQANGQTDDDYSSIVSINLRHDGFAYVAALREISSVAKVGEKYEAIAPVSASSDGTGQANSERARGPQLPTTYPTARSQTATDTMTTRNMWSRVVRRSMAPVRAICNSMGVRVFSTESPASASASASRRIPGSTNAQQARQPPSSMSLSSLELVEKYLRRKHANVVVERFHLGSAVMSRQPMLYIWTFGEQLTVSVDFNEAYYDAGFMADVLSGTVKCLARELGLRLETV